jgi:hypothetical protein
MEHCAPSTLDQTALNDRSEHWDNILRYESVITQEETKIMTVLAQIEQKND